MKKAYKIIILCLFVTCTCFILFLSGQDGEEAFDTTYEIAKPVADVVYEEPSNDQVEDVMLVIRNSGRVIAFTVFGILLALNVHVWTTFRWKYKAILIVVITVLFSIFDEVHKLAIEGRHCTLAEIMVNVLCSMIAGLVVCFICNKFSKGCKEDKPLI